MLQTQILPTPSVATSDVVVDNPLLATVGGRVKQRRNRSRMPRRVLSELSGVSERFLAQLEHGKGNISIVRLKSIADALQMTLEELVCDPTTPASQAPATFDDWRAHPGAIADLYRHAGAREQAMVVELLIGSRRAAQA